jgi:hypothetical protein
VFFLILRLFTQASPSLLGTVLCCHYL